MFDDSGDKIKGLATAVCVIGVIISIIGGIALVAIGSNLNNSYYTKGTGTAYIWTGIIVAAIGTFASWASSLILSGFGELICSQQRTEGVTKEIIKKLNSTPKENETVDKASVRYFDDLPKL